MKLAITQFSSFLLLYSAFCIADENVILPVDNEKESSEQVAMIPSLYKTAVGEIESGNNGKANVIFDEILLRSPEHRQARLQKGRLFIEQGDISRALQMLEPLLVVDDANWEVWFWMGTASLLNGNLNDASSYLDTALSYNSQVTEIWVQRAIVAQENGNLDGAVQLLGMAIDIAPDDPLIWLNYAYVNDLMNNKKKAITAYRQFFKLSTNRSGFSKQRKAVVSILLKMKEVK